MQVAVSGDRSSILAVLVSLVLYCLTRRVQYLACIFGSSDNGIIMPQKWLSLNYTHAINHGLIHVYCALTAAIFATGIIWSRYSTQITPVNYNLLSVNMFMAVTGGIQLFRKMT